MKKTIFVIASLFIYMATAAKVTITNVLSTIPEHIAPYIDKDRKEEIGKFSNENDSLEIKNSLNGTTRIRTISDDFALVELSKSALLQIKLLSSGDTAQIICVVRTIKSPVAESEVKFYSTDWNEIDRDYGLPRLDAAAMLSALTVRPDTMAVARFNELQRYIEPVIVNACFDEKGEVITFGLGVPFTTKEMVCDIKAIIKKKSFKWDGEIFREC